jgi:hypothetical protein
MKTHEDVDVQFILLVYGGDVRGAEIVTGDARAQ